MNTSRTRVERRNISTFARVAAVAIAAVVLISAAQAAPGDLDPTFGSGGRVTTAVAGRDAVSEAIALQADGKIIAAGWSRDGSTFPPAMSFLVARYNADGTLDTTFGNAGLATATVGSSSAANAVAIQPDGKILAGGFTWDWPGSFALARFNSDGTLDPTFGDSGKVITNIGQANNQINAIALQVDGKIVVGGGNADAGNAAENFVAVRYQADGTLDNTFGSGGVAFTNFGGGGVARGLTIQADGKIVEVGPAGISSYPFEAFGLVRFNTDGSLDTGFGPGGKVTTSFPGAARAWDVTLQPDQKLIAVGEAFTNSGNGGFGVARYNTDGSLDPSFGEGGKVITDFGSSSDPARAVALHDDGRIVVAGMFVTPSFSGDFALAQYAPNGSLDASFGVGGKVTTDFSGASEAVNGVVVQRDGKVVAAGAASPSSGFATFALARYAGAAADTTPPTLNVSVSPNVLRPPNHEYVTVRATVTATDETDPSPVIELVSVTSNEADNGEGDGNTVNDIVILDRYTFRLRAERNEYSTGRSYTITYRATDKSGNSTTRGATVTVPVDTGS